MSNQPHDSHIDVTLSTPENTRRDFLKKSTGILGAAALMNLVAPGVRSGAWAAGSDAPEKTEVKIGFIPLTDCASVVHRQRDGFRQKIRHQNHPQQEKPPGPLCATSW